MMELLKHIYTNGIVLFIPIHLWNMLFWKKLPPAFEDKTFDKNIPKPVLISETIFRLIIFYIKIILLIIVIIVLALVAYYFFYKYIIMKKNALLSLAKLFFLL